MTRTDGVGYEIFDVEDCRRYINVVFDHKNEAETEKETLLIGFGPENPWRKRLVVRRLGPKY